MSVTDEYNDIERNIKETQIEIREALAHISANNDVIGTSDCRTTICMDFLSIFDRADLPYDFMCDDVVNIENMEPFSSSSPLSNRLPDSSVPRRSEPVRPTTLSRPLQLPDCCNFRKQPWRVYVNGDFSYRSTPRFYHGVDGEIGAAKNNEDLVRIIEDLSRNGTVSSSASAVSDVLRQGPTNAEASDQNEVSAVMRNINATPSVTENAGNSRSRNPVSSFHQDVAVDSADCTASPLAGKEADQQKFPEDITKVFDGHADGTPGKMVLRTGRRPVASGAMNHNMGPVETASFCSKLTSRRGSCTDSGAMKSQRDDMQSSSLADKSLKSTSSPVSTFNVESPNALKVEEKERSTLVLQSALPTTGSSKLRLKSRRSRNRSLQRVDRTTSTTGVAEDDVRTPPRRYSAANRRARTLSPATAGRGDVHLVPAKEVVTVDKRSSFEVDHVPTSSSPTTRTPQRHVTSSSLPAIDENDLQAVTTHGRLPSGQPSCGFWLDVNEAGQVIAKQSTVSSSSSLDRRQESLLDVMHKRFYPRQYGSTGSGCSKDESEMRPAEHSMVPSSDVTINTHVASAVGSIDQSSAGSSQENLVRRSDSVESTADLAHKATDDDLIDASPGQQTPTDGVTPACFPADINATYEPLNESRLLEACQWLVAAGFPQYVQLLIERKLNEACVSPLASEYSFLPSNWLTAVTRRLEVLLRYSSSKMNLSEDFLRSMDAFVVNEIHQLALSRHWRYDCARSRWQYVTSSSPEVTSSLSMAKALSRSASAATNGDFESLSPSLTDADTGNHVTSGYESESTSYDHMMTSSSDVSPLTSLSSTISSGRSLAEGNTALSPPSYCRSQSTPNSVDDERLVALRPKKAKATVMLPRSVSFYDNLLQSDTSLMDPQAELETILDDLRRNISALDAALAASSCATTPVCFSPSDVATSVDNYRQKLEKLDDIAESTDNRGQLEDPYCLMASQCNDSSGRTLVKELRATELAVARQLSVITITSLLDEHCKFVTSPGIVNSLVRCVSSTVSTTIPGGCNYDNGKRAFGVSLDTQLRTSGRVLPQCISNAMDDVIALADQSDGVFRKPGTLSHVQKLQNAMEAQPDIAIKCENAEDVYNFADVIKRYFRDLPESLLTDRLSPMLAAIFDYFPEERQHIALQSAILLLPDANRLALYQLLKFLHKVASFSTQNQMTAANLAVCFLPSLFRLTDYLSKAAQETANSDEDYKPTYKSALACLTSMIENYEILLGIADETVRTIHQLVPKVTRESLQLVPCPNSDVIVCGPGWISVSDHVGSLFSKLDLQSDSLCWVPDRVNSSDGVTVVRQMSLSVSGLLTWRATVDIEASPSDVLNRLIAVEGRSNWDSAIHQWKHCLSIDASTDVVEYTMRADELAESRLVCLLRSWKTHPHNGNCVMVSTSIASPKQMLVENHLLATVFLSHYVIEQCGTGMSRLVHFSSIDLGGLTPDWYRSVYGRLCARHVTNIRDSFSHDSSATWSAHPETIV